MSLFKRQISQPNWVIDQDAIKRAAEILDLKHPVAVKLFPKRIKWWGQYDPLHLVRVNATMPAHEVSYTIWHEMVHALQCERDYDCDGEAYLDAVQYWYDDFRETWTPKHPWPKKKWMAKYNAIPMEVEANSMAKRYAHRYTLIAQSSFLRCATD